MYTAKCVEEYDLHIVFMKQVYNRRCHKIPDFDHKGHVFMLMLIFDGLEATLVSTVLFIADRDTKSP